MDIAEQEGSPSAPVGISEGERNGPHPRCALLLKESKELREQLIIAQRRYREKEMELRSAEKLVNEKDILLKDCLERLHAALRAERVQLAKEEEARAWADECQSKLLYEAQNHLVAKTAAEVAETKLAEALSAKEKHDTSTGRCAYDAPERSSECS